ncbi:histidinol-phosphatase (PHP family) [Peptoniphilus ivorii]|uniref:histidinol-phosphatase HisJ family protein n=1 Tax=Aedoeadaptatus ivorii TaxID=54006 RepID=UPI0027812890|nr:histidinol-phosphatase HisJ family protein [Peptoniphilus ivorii]MDQ0508666.1 histidinol-phosphatase (PHP family) [Peptoniphilus ivorii]
MIDIHTHSRFSMDSIADPEKNVVNAIERGIEVLAFTDHIDRTIENESIDYTFNFNEYIEVLDFIRHRYAERIEVLIGLEIGLNLNVKTMMEELMENLDFDFFIGSIHSLDEEDIATVLRRSTPDIESYYTHYYETMLENIETTRGFQVVGHIDYIDRYIEDKSAIPPFSAYRDIVAAILEAAIQKDLAIEYNTAGRYKGLDHANPKDEILSLYRDLGGDNVTLSSDAHKSVHIGRGIAAGAAHLEALGFEEVVYYRKKKPVRRRLR